MIVRLTQEFELENVDADSVQDAVREMLYTMLENDEWIEFEIAKEE